MYVEYFILHPHSLQKSYYFVPRGELISLVFGHKGSWYLNANFARTTVLFQNGSQFGEELRFYVIYFHTVSLGHNSNRKVWLGSCKRNTNWWMVVLLCAL